MYECMYVCMYVLDDICNIGTCAFDFFFHGTLRIHPGGHTRTTEIHHNNNNNKVVVFPWPTVAVGKDSISN